MPRPGASKWVGRKKRPRPKPGSRWNIGRSGSDRWSAKNRLPSAPYGIVTDLLVLLVAPSSSVTVSVTVYVPELAYL